MVQFTSLSSGSSGNCYFFDADGFGLLVDLGIGIRIFRKHFANYGLNLSHVRGILVTHDHTDHVKSVGSLSMKFNLPVYTSEAVHRSIQANHFVGKKVPDNLKRVLTKGVCEQIGPFSVQTFHVPHDSADNNGYIIRIEELTIVLLTDVGSYTDEMKTIVSQATHLIVEANYDSQMLESGPYPPRLKKRISCGRGHSSNAETAAFLAENLNPDLIRRVWLCHLSAENNTPVKAIETVKEALLRAGFPVGSPETTLKLEALARLTPSLPVEL